MADNSIKHIMPVINNMLIITPWYPTEQKPLNYPFIVDHIESWLRYIPQFQNNNPCNVGVIHTQIPLDLPNILFRGKRPVNKEVHDKYFLEQRQPVRITNRIDRGRFGAELRSVVLSYKRIYKQYFQDHPDIIIAQTLSGALWAYKLKHELKLSAPIVLIEHSSRIEMHLLTKERKNLFMEVLNGIDYIISVSNRLESILSSTYTTTNISTIWNPVNDLFVSTAFNNKKTNPPFKIITVGRLVPDKAQHRLIKAIGKIQSDLVDKVEIIGDGYLKDNLEKLVFQLGLNDKIVFKGGLDRYDIIERLDNADIFVLPSKTENCPVALIEAQTRGLPCIVSKNNASEFILLRNNGYAVEPDSTGDSISKALNSFFINYGNFNREEIRTTSLTYFAPEVFAQKTYEVFKSLLM